jgi:hypothetical protein
VKNTPLCQNGSNYIPNPQDFHFRASNQNTPYSQAEPADQQRINNLTRLANIATAHEEQPFDDPTQTGSSQVGIPSDLINNKYSKPANPNSLTQP